MRRLTQTLLVLLLFSSIASLNALEPLVVLSSGGGATWVKESGQEATLYPYGELGGTVAYRNIFGETGYYAASLFGGLRYYGEELDDFKDEQLLSLELGTVLGKVGIEAETSVSASLYNLGNGVALLPAWQLTARPDPWGRRLTPRGTYFGSYLYEEEALTDKLVQGVRLGVEGDPSIRFGWFADILGAYERFPDQEATLDGDTREDGRFSLILGGDGLIGFFTSWDVENETGFRLSNAENPSEDRFFSDLAGSVQFSPVQELGIEVGGAARQAYYLDREALDKNGAPTGNSLQQLSLSGLLRLDYTPDGALFFVLEGGAARSFSEDPSFDGWSGRVSAQVEYSF